MASLPRSGGPWWPPAVACAFPCAEIPAEPATSAIPRRALTASRHPARSVLLLTIVPPAPRRARPENVLATCEHARRAPGMEGNAANVVDCRFRGLLPGVVGWNRAAHRSPGAGRSDRLGRAVPRGRVG